MQGGDSGGGGGGWLRTKSNRHGLDQARPMESGEKVSILLEG